MTQFQYDVIVKVICNGAPAIADELCEAFAEIVTERNSFKQSLDEMTDKFKEEENK